MVDGFLDLPQAEMIRRIAHNIAGLGKIIAESAQEKRFDDVKYFTGLRSEARDYMEILTARTW